MGLLQGSESNRPQVVAFAENLGRFDSDPSCTRSTNRKTYAAE